MNNKNLKYAFLFLLQPVGAIVRIVEVEYFDYFCIGILLLITMLVLFKRYINKEKLFKTATDAENKIIFLLIVVSNIVTLILSKLFRYYDVHITF